jgi:hypothetical protein
MATHVFTKYKIPVFWDNEFKQLDYVQEKFNDPVKLQEWADMGFQNVATGFMCDMRSPQPSWNDKIKTIYSEMGWQDIGTSYYRMDSGAILPNHGDLYKKYVELFALQGREHTIRRAIIFLEVWSSGHYSACAGRAIVEWHAGDVVEWQYDTPHTAANLGITPRYTLQVTGHV